MYVRSIWKHLICSNNWILIFSLLLGLVKLLKQSWIYYIFLEVTHSLSLDFSGFCLFFSHIFIVYCPAIFSYYAMGTCNVGNLPTCPKQNKISYFQLSKKILWEKKASSIGLIFCQLSCSSLLTTTLPTFYHQKYETTSVIKCISDIMINFELNWMKPNVL